MRTPSIVIGLALATITIAATTEADAQRRTRPRAPAQEEPAAVDPSSGEPAIDPRLDAEARQLFLAGEAAYDAGRYEAALDYFERAFALTGRPALLFNIGSVTERLRRDDEALRSYERYLEAMPDAPNRAFVESRIEFLREQIAADWREREPSEPAVSEEPAATARPPVDEEIARGEDREGTDVAALVVDDPRVDPQDDRGGGDITEEWWFWTLIGVAVVGAGVGIGVAVATSDSGASSPPVTGDFGPGGVIVALESW